MTNIAEPAPNPWFSWSYVTSHLGELLAAGEEHVYLTVLSVTLAVIIAFPLALLVRRYPRLAGPVLATGGIMYTIPSLALMSLLWPVFGLSPWTVIVALAVYAFLVVLRNCLVGLKGVPTDAVDAARALGFTPQGILWKVEIPLAVPTIMAGIRIATVSTVGLVTIGALVGYGGYGSLIYSGFLANFWHAQIMTATICCVVLAFIFELLLMGLQRVLTPWTRGAKTRPWNRTRNRTRRDSTSTTASVAVAAASVEVSA